LRNGILQLGERSIHHVALLEHHLGELVFLPVDPEVGEGFLGGVEDLDQVVQRGGNWIVVENPVRCREVLPVLSRSSLQKRESEQVLQALQVLAAGLKPMLGVEVIKNLVSAELLDGVFGVLLTDDQLAPCLCHSLNGVEDQACGELGDVRCLVDFPLEFNLLASRHLGNF